MSNVNIKYLVKRREKKKEREKEKEREVFNF